MIQEIFNKLKYKRELFKHNPNIELEKDIQFLEDLIKYMLRPKDIDQIMIDCCKYGYEYHQTSRFPETKFEDECINNFKQYFLSKSND